MSKPDDLRDIPDHISPAAVRILRARTKRILLVQDGMLPTTPELMSGYPFCEDSIERDIMLWCQQQLLLGGNEKLIAALENFKVAPNPDSCRLVLDADEEDLGIDRDRIRLYAACLGDNAFALELRDNLRKATMHFDGRSFAGLISRIMAEGFGMICSSPDQAYSHGYKRMRDMHAIAAEYFAAEKWLVDGMPSDMEAMASAEAIIRATAEDRSETAPATTAGIIVVPALGHGSTSHKRDLFRPWSGIAGQPIPLVARGDVVAQRESLVSKWPHASELIDIILSDLAAKDVVGFRPTCLVGAPGCGKTSLARAIAEIVAVPVEIVPLGGVADSSLMGTSAQWSTARESIPLQIIRRGGVANPMLVWDEIEKAAASGFNGNPLDALLPMLERNQSRAVRDPALEVECDLSAVSHFATANSLDGVPAPLRDRMRILHMPDPTWTHIGSLTENILFDLMRSRGLDARWVSPLAQDELEVIKGAWPGGSLRQLVRIVEKFVDGREMTWGRA